MTRSPSPTRHIALLLLAAGSLTCSGDGTNPNNDPAKLAVTTQPSSSAVNGQPLAVQPVVQVQDADGDNVAAPNGTTITASVAGGGATVQGTATVTPDANGKATFTDLAVAGGSGTYTLQFSANGLTSATSSDITLAGGPPSTITATVQPTSALDKEVFDPAEQPVVSVTDAGGNPAPNVLVTATIASGTGTLQGRDTATTDGSGVARFTDLGISGTGSQTLGFSGGGATGTSSPINIGTLSAQATSGEWDAPVSWDIVPLHMHLLPTGKILAWGRTESDGSMGEPRLWNLPSGQAPSSAPMVMADTMLFCSGHSFMADGRLIVSGGHKSDDHGLDVTNIFDPQTETWVPGLPKMAKGRWYPTVTELPNGNLVTVAGRDTTGSGQVVTIPEVWNGTSWTQLTGAVKILPYYPRDFVDPTDGRIFYAGELPKSEWLDVNGTGSWSTNGPTHKYMNNREYGSAVMYELGKILYVGGGGDQNWNTPGINPPEASVPTPTAETIDLTAPSPQWAFTGSMAFARRHLNATVLPDGQVLVTGGTSAGGFNDLSGSVHQAEIWNPTSGNWTTVASSAVDRAYHSVSILLPDATVLHGASGNADDVGGNPFPDQKSHEIYHPPYLFKGARPTITNVASPVSYAANFTVTTPNAAQITTVRITRLGSVTHAFDQNGRTMTLSFTAGAGSISVTAPADENKAPPGDYLLFVLNRNGVPSAGKVVRIQ
jgi:hypothetical protein